MAASPDPARSVKSSQPITILRPFTAPFRRRSWRAHENDRPVIVIGDKSGQYADLGEAADRPGRSRDALADVQLALSLLAREPSGPPMTLEQCAPPLDLFDLRRPAGIGARRLGLRPRPIALANADAEQLRAFRTISPALAATAEPVPPVGARTTCSIFMASNTMRPSPAATTSPGATETVMTVPCISARTTSTPSPLR